MKNNMKKIKGLVRFVESDGYDEDVTNSPYLAAKSNPDLVSDENSLMFPERDFDDEQARVAYIEDFKQALAKLTLKQRAIVDALNRHGNQLDACVELGIAQPTLSLTLSAIQKKITKAINKMQKGR